MSCHSPKPTTDEVDAFLTKRGIAHEHEATLQVGRVLCTGMRGTWGAG